MQESCGRRIGKVTILVVLLTELIACGSEPKSSSSSSSLQSPTEISPVTENIPQNISPVLEEDTKFFPTTSLSTKTCGNLTDDSRGQSDKMSSLEAAKFEEPASDRSLDLSLSEDLKLKAFYSPHLSERIEALISLGSVNDKEKVLSIARAALIDDSPEVRGAALGVIGDRFDDMPIEAVRRTAFDDPDPNTRMTALMLLSQRDLSAAMEPLTAARFDSNPDVRRFADDLLETLH